MRILKKRLIAICLVLAVIFAGFSNTLVSADADKKDDFVLNIDFNVLRKCGFQKNGTGWCACYSLAYCRALLDGKKHSKDEFHAAGSEYADWKSAGYEKKTYSATNAGAKKLWKKLYKTLSKGRPAIIYTCGSGSYGHYVTIVGYKDVTNINNLSEKNFIFIDSMAAAATRDESGKLRHVVQSLDDKYSLAPNGGHYEIVLTKEKGQSDAVLSKSKAKALLGDLKSISFKVSAPKTSISKCSISLLKKTYEYSGNKIKAKVKVKFGSTTLKKNKDYKIKYKHNKEIGNARIIIKGIGKFKGKVKMIFKIVPEDHSSDIKSLEVNDLSDTDITNEDGDISGEEVILSEELGSVNEEAEVLSGMMDI